MTVSHKTLLVPRTAHIHQIGTLSSETTDVWVVLHGYGQLARYFIRHFEVLQDERTAVIAPEALSRFYLEGFSGRVGATWMTKEERQQEIIDYITYLNLVWEQITQEAPKTRLHVVGFSQGAATACRWLAQGNMPVEELVLWAGVFPEDMEMASARQTLATVRLSYVYGAQDPFVANEKVEEQLQRVKAAGLTPEVLTFQGAHELNREVLTQLKNRSLRY